MIIELEFEDPLLVSREYSFDQLQIIFLDHRMFVSEKMEVMPKNWTMKAKIPTQGFVPQIEAVETLVDAMGKVQVVVFSSSAIVNSLMELGMSQLLGIIQSLQIAGHM